MTAPLRLRRFLVGLDGTGRSDHAAHAAAVLAGKLSAELELVHAVDVPPAMWVHVTREDLARLHAAALGRAREKLVHHLEEVEREHALARGSLAGHLEVQPGRPGRVLLDRMRETEADVLFVGPHAERGLLDLGSTTRAVLHHVEGGVWLQAGPWRPIESILVPVDLTDEAPFVLSTARELAERLSAEVVVLHAAGHPAVAPPREYADTIGWPVPAMEAIRERARGELDRLVGSLDWRGVEHRSVLSGDPPQVAIHALQDQAQLVVLGTHGRGAVSRFLLGSVAYAVLKDARGGVLAVRPPAS